MPHTPELAVELERARRLSDSLFAQVRPEAFLDRPIAERHRILFYLGHLEAFDWNQVARGYLHLRPVSETLDDLFAFGIDPPPGQLPADTPADWPTLAETTEYVQRVRRCLDTLPAPAPDEAWHMAIEHRLMHVETFSYILHNLPYERRLPGPEVAPVDAPPPRHALVQIPAGHAQLGRRHGTGFGWDNEFGEYGEEVAAFAIDRYKVTNAQYLAFVEAGGPVPHYWTRTDDGWFYRGMTRLHPLPPDWPVYVSHAQASAFAAWRGRQLPTEGQLQRAAFAAPDGGARRYPWGDAAPTPRHGNFDCHRADPVPVTATPDGDSAFGVAQLVGNGWEWTRTPFAPFPGFEPVPTYPGYSANFFDDGHYVLKGASPVTDRLLLRPTFRNWFRPHYPYAYTTFRLVEE